MKQEEPKDQRNTPEAPEHSPPPSPSAEAPDHSVVFEDHTAPPVTTPEPGAQRDGSEERTKRLLAAYQETLEVAEDLPAVVWVRWGGKGLGRFLKVPYLRWFVGYYLTHHIHRNLTILNRRLNIIAALASDPDVNTADREAMKLYLQNLPPPPYRRLAFAILFVALLVALPLRSLGDVTHVFDLAGAIMKVDIGGVAKAFTANELWETLRSMLVLLFSFSVVACLLTSPFVLKRMLFNLYPATKERLDSTTAREQSFSVEGLYELEDRVFGEFGLRGPKEVPFDLLLRAFVLVLVLLLSVYLGTLVVVVALFAAASEDLVAEFGRTVTFSWEGILILAFSATSAIIFFMAFVIGLKRLLIAWRRRTRSASN